MSSTLGGGPRREADVEDGKMDEVDEDEVDKEEIEGKEEAGDGDDSFLSFTGASAKRVAMRG
jgi:hypothetical protein